VENIGVQVTKEEPKYWFWSKILGVYIVFCTNGKIIYLWSSGEVKSMNGLRNINGYVQRTYLLCYVFSTDHRASHKGTEKILGVEKSKWSDYVLTWTFPCFNKLDPFLSFFLFVVAHNQCVSFARQSGRLQSWRKIVHAHAWNLISGWQYLRGVSE